MGGCWGDDVSHDFPSGPRPAVVQNGEGNEELDRHALAVASLCILCGILAVFPFCLQAVLKCGRSEDIGGRAVYMYVIVCINKHSNHNPALSGFTFSLTLSFSASSCASRAGSVMATLHFLQWKGSSAPCQYSRCTWRHARVGGCG